MSVMVQLSQELLGGLGAGSSLSPVLDGVRGARLQCYMIIFGGALASLFKDAVS